MDGQTLDSLADMICGDGQDYPVYRKGYELTRFFQRVGFSNFTHDGSTRKLRDESRMSTKQLFDKIMAADESS